MAGPLLFDPPDDPPDGVADGVLGWLAGPKKVPVCGSGLGRIDWPATRSAKVNPVTVMSRAPTLRMMTIALRMPPLSPVCLVLGSTVERGFWAADGMMVQVGGLRLAANGGTA
jgi:hypothetical protein